MISFDTPLFLVLALLSVGTIGIGVDNDPQLLVLGMLGLASGLLLGAVKIGYKLGIMFRHKVESPYLFAKLSVMGPVLLIVGCVFDLFMFTDTLVNKMQGLGFATYLWTYWLKLGLVHLLLILVGIGHGLVDTRPGLSSYELER